MSKYCTKCEDYFIAPGDHWYIKSKYRGKVYYSCKLYEQEKAKKQCKVTKSRSYKAWAERNKEYNKKRWQDYYLNNKDYLIQRSTLQSAQDRRDPLKRAAMNLRSRLWAAIKSDAKTGSAIRDLGCSISEFKLYIENQFLDGMTWDNYGEWHLDHVIPLCKFDLSDRTEFLEASNFLNIQPLWAKDNYLKGGR